MATESLGKNVRFFKVYTFVIGGGLAAVAGSLFAHYMTYISPANFTVDESIFVYAILIIGGTANAWGPIIGAIIVISAMEALRFMQISPAIVGFTRQIAYGIILILFMCFRPQGLLPEFTISGKKNEEKVNNEDKFEEGLRQAKKPNSFAAFFQINNGKMTRQLSSRAFLKLNGVSKKFGGLSAINGCSLELEEGKIVGLIGPNGAGKTTLFNLITGFYSPDTGSVNFDGKDISVLPAYQITNLGIARSFQNLRLFHRMTVLDNVLVARPRQTGESLLGVFLRFSRVSQEEKQNHLKALAFLEFVGLANKAEDLAMNLSFAEQKLLSLARLLSTEARLILLDEPASGLDPLVMEDLFPLIKELVNFGKTICIVEHNMDIIRAMVDEIVFLNEGRVLARGTPQQIMNAPELVEIYFGGAPKKNEHR